MWSGSELKSFLLNFSELSAIRYKTRDFVCVYVYRREIKMSSANSFHCMRSFALYDTSLLSNVYMMKILYK